MGFDIKFGIKTPGGSTPVSITPTLSGTVRNEWSLLNGFDHTLTGSVSVKNLELAAGTVTGFGYWLPLKSMVTVGCSPSNSETSG